MSRVLQLLARILRVLLMAGSLVFLYIGFADADETYALFAAVVLAVFFIGFSPALWPKLPAAPERPAPVPAPPQPGAYPQQQQYGQTQQPAAYPTPQPPQQGTTYGGQAQVQQQPQWPAQPQQPPQQ